MVLIMGNPIHSGPFIYFKKGSQVDEKQDYFAFTSPKKPKIPKKIKKVTFLSVTVLQNFIFLNDFKGL